MYGACLRRCLLHFLPIKMGGLPKIAKTGSLCCVAARPHGSNTASRDWSMGPQEPYWQTNTSFSPPPSRWDFRFQPDGLSYGSHDGFQLFGSSTSSNSKESSGWVRGNLLYSHQSTSNGAGLFLRSPSDLSQGSQWTPPAIQEITVDDYQTATRRDRIAGQLPCASIVEGTSTNADSGVSTSSYSDSSESEPLFKSCLSSHRNFSSRHHFMSKPIHPLSFPMGTPTTEVSDSGAAGFSDDAATPQRDAHRWSSASSSNDFADVSEPFESEIFGRSCIPSEGFKCGLCERNLSQRSPWSSRRIVRSSDMPVAGVLSCRHVFHAECLEQTTPKTRKSDPPCPLCVRVEEQNSPENRVFPRFRNGFPRLRPFSEDGSSRSWGCAQAGDCVEGALHAPQRSTMLLLNRSRMKKNLVKGNSSKKFPGKLRKSGSSSLQLFGGKSIDQGAIECSKTIGGPSVKR